MIRRLRRRLAIILTAITGCILLTVLGISLWYTVQQAKTAALERLATDAALLTISLNTDGGADHNVEVLDAFRAEKEYILSFKVDGEPQMDESALSPKELEIIALAEEAVSDYSVVYSTTATAAALPGLFSSIDLVELRDSVWISAETVDPQEDVIADDGGDLSPGSGAADAETAEGIHIMFNYSTDGYLYPAFTYEGADYRVNSIELSDVGADGAPAGYHLMVIEELTGESRLLLLIYLGYAAAALGGMLLLYLVNWFLTKLVVKPTEEGLRRQTEFVAAASHELRSPLTTLRASLLAADVADTAQEAEKFRGCALREADRMGRLLGDLLLLAGSDSKNWGVEKRPFDVDTLLIETHEQYGPLAKERDRRLRLQLPDKALPECTGDRDRIRQVLSVLLDNAMEYAPVGSAVTLRADVKGKKLLLSVIDEGSGIPDEEKKRIFDRFYRADKSRTDKAHFGLGLSVAKEIAQLHGGAISVHDEPGGGTRFTLQLNL